MTLLSYFKIDSLSLSYVTNHKKHILDIRSCCTEPTSDHSALILALCTHRLFRNWLCFECTANSTVFQSLVFSISQSTLCLPGFLSTKIHTVVLKLFFSYKTIRTQTCFCDDSLSKCPSLIPPFFFRLLFVQLNHQAVAENRVVLVQQCRILQDIF